MSMEGPVQLVLVLFLFHDVYLTVALILLNIRL